MKDKRYRFHELVGLRSFQQCAREPLFRGLILCAFWSILSVYAVISMILIIKIVDVLTGSTEDLRNLMLTLGAWVGFPAVLYQLQLRNDQNRIQDRGLVNDRIKAAVDQMSASEIDTDTRMLNYQVRKPNIANHLAGIYALERIAFDHAETTYEIIRIFVDYLCDNAPDRIKGDADRIDPAPNVQAAILALGRIGATMEDVEKTKNDKKRTLERAELDDTTLESWREVDPQLRLRGKVFDHVHFFGCFIGIDFENCSFSDARMRDVRFHRASLREADLSGVEAGGATFRNCDFLGTVMRDTRFDKLADLSGENLGVAVLENTDFGTAKLEGASFAGHRERRGLNFAGARLYRAKFKNGILLNCQFDRAKLGNTDFSGADLESCGGLKQRQVRDMIGDRRTKLPDGLVSPPEWKPTEAAIEPEPRGRSR